MKRFHLLTILTLILPMALFSKETLTVGDEAPALTVTTHTGAELDLGETYAEGPVLVYFYPKSDTPGCTKQACNIRDNFSAIQEAGITVIGVSIDDVESQEAFREKYELPFTLVADKDKRLGTAFGVGGWMGLAYKRQSFLVVDGKIAWRDLSASPASQSQDILDALEAVKKQA